MLRICSRCGNCHIGCLIFARPGWRTLFRSEWENLIGDQAIEFQARNQITRVKLRMGNLVSFI